MLCVSSLCALWFTLRSEIKQIQELETIRDGRNVLRRTRPERQWELYQIHWVFAAFVVLAENDNEKQSIIQYKKILTIPCSKVEKMYSFLLKNPLNN